MLGLVRAERLRLIEGFVPNTQPNDAVRADAKQPTSAATPASSSAAIRSATTARGGTTELRARRARGVLSGIVIDGSRGLVLRMSSSIRLRWGCKFRFQGVPTVKTTKGYPWDKWFEKNRFVLIQGEDFLCQVHGMAVQVRQRAAERGLKVSVQTDGDMLYVTVVGRPEGEPE